MAGSRTADNGSALAPAQERVGWRVLLAASSGVLAALPFLDGAWFITAWFAFVPLLLSLRDASLRASYCCGLVAGLAFYLAAAPWIIEFLVLFKGESKARSFGFALLFWFYCSQLPALLALSLSWIQRWSQLPLLITFPVLLVSFYAGFPMLFPVQLGESQSHFLPALQGTAWTGVYGLDFVVGIANATLFQIIVWRDRALSMAPLAAGLLVAGWLGYGWHASSAWETNMSTWPTRTIGIVQPNEVPSVERRRVSPGYSRAYPPEMEMTERLAAAGAELVVWPESRHKGFFDDPQVREAFSREVARIGRPLLLQDMESHQLASPNEDSAGGRYNSVALLQADGSQQGSYRKIKRVAFGEALPILGQLPVIRSWIEGYFGSFFREITPGESAVTFVSDGMKIVPLICYETMFPVFAARALPDEAAGALLVAVSSDGWFGSTRQPYQHVKASVLRAVENRVPMVHVVNNGPSAAVLPNGRIVFQSELGQAGGFVAKIPHSPDSGGSFFSRFPGWFITTVYGLMLAVLASALWHRRRVHRGQGGLQQTESRFTA